MEGERDDELYDSEAGRERNKGKGKKGNGENHKQGTRKKGTICARERIKVH